MKSSIADELNIAAQPGQELFSKDRSILERKVMEFRPFGLDEQGQTIRDMSGMSIRAVVVYLESSQARERGASAGTQAVDSNRYRGHNALSSLTHHLRAPSSIGAKLTKRAFGKLHGQGGGSRRDVHHSEFNRTGCELVSEIGKHAVDLGE